MYRIKADKAQFPILFPQELEFNPPVHGTWNIVHISMLVPEAHSIYVCSDNCMRGVVMTAAEMGCLDRFSCVTLRERDVMVDNLETITIEGVSNVIEHLEKHPPAVFLFLVCLHIFTSSDEEYILKKLRERYPDICFVRCYMDCVRQKTGPTPDMKLRGFEYEPIEIREKKPGRVNVLGCDLPYKKDSELLGFLEQRGCIPMQLQDCGTWEEYQKLGEAELNICTYMNAQEGLQRLSERIGSKYLYLPPAVDYEEIRKEYEMLLRMLDHSETAGTDESEQNNTCVEGRSEAAQDNSCAAGPDEALMTYCKEQESLCEEALTHLREAIGDGEVMVDYTCHQRPLGIAKLLLTHGIRVGRVYLDAVLPEEEETLHWLKDHYPELELTATIRPQEIRSVELSNPGKTEGSFRDSHKVLALGQKAAWFEQTGFFVNMIESGGLWGYEGIRGLCSRMEEALLEEKDLRNIVPRKGLGWPSLCDVPGEKVLCDVSGGCAL